MHPKLFEWQRQGSYFQFHQLRIFYRVVGEGPVLLIIHGYPYSGFDFHMILPALARQFKVIIPDMPGMGFSDKPDPHHYSFQEMADAYTALLQHLSIDEVHVLAHDLGNSVTQELLARSSEHRNPFAIRSIAFLNGGLFSDVYRPRLIQVLLSKSPPFFGRWLSGLMTKNMVSRATAEVFGEHTKPSAELQDLFWEILNYNAGKRIAYRLGRLVFEKDKHQTRWIGAMQKTHIPMYFINGPADPNSGMHMANRYKQLIPQPRVYLLHESIGHWPQLEAPEQTVQAFFTFHQQERTSLS